MSLDKRIAISEESYGVSEEKRMRTNMIFVIRIYYWTCKQPCPASQNASKQHIRGWFHILSLEANTWRLKNIACNRNEPKQCINTWQITKVSNSTKRHADNSGNHEDLWP